MKLIGLMLAAASLFTSRAQAQTWQDVQEKMHIIDGDNEKRNLSLRMDDEFVLTKKDKVSDYAQFRFDITDSGFVPGVDEVVNTELFFDLVLSEGHGLSSEEAKLLVSLNHRMKVESAQLITNSGLDIGTSLEVQTRINDDGKLWANIFRTNAFDHVDVTALSGTLVAHAAPFSSAALPLALGMMGLVAIRRRF